MFSLATLVYINEYKAQSNCNQDPTFRHSSLVSSSGVHINMSNHALNRDDGAYLSEEYVHLIGR
jgi:hypothetical protein